MGQRIKWRKVPFSFSVPFYMKPSFKPSLGFYADDTPWKRLIGQTDLEQEQWPVGV